jgi:hypothetical protein
VLAQLDGEFAVLCWCSEWISLGCTEKLHEPFQLHERLLKACMATRPLFMLDAAGLFKMYQQVLVFHILGSNIFALQSLSLSHIIVTHVCFNCSGAIFLSPDIFIQQRQYWPRSQLP